MLKLAAPLFGWASAAQLDTITEASGSIALEVITLELRRLEAEHLRIAQHCEDASSEMALRSNDLMKRNADLRVVNKQTLAQLEDARAQLEQARAELEAAKAAQLLAEEARGRAEASLTELRESHQEQLAHIETLRSDLIDAVIESEDVEEEELSGQAPAVLVAEHYAPGTGGVDLRPALAGASGRASSVQLCTSARASPTGLERPLPEVGWVKYGAPPTPLNPSPRVVLKASPRSAGARQLSHNISSVVEVDVDHKGSGGCCSVQ
jgi:hypothetical protein